MSNLTRYKMRIEDSPNGECQAVVSVASTTGRWVKFDDIKELLNSSHNIDYTAALETVREWFKEHVGSYPSPESIKTLGVRLNSAKAPNCT